VADVPGLIEGAHQGHGLGDQFLKHIERTKVLVHLVDLSSESGRDPVEDFEIIRRELKSYSAEVFAKPQITVANKMDALDEPDRLKRLVAHLKKKKLPLLKISGATGDGVDKLLEAMWKAIAARPIARRRRSSDRPQPDQRPDADKGIDLLTPARSRRRGV
jgi:GTPase